VGAVLSTTPRGECHGSGQVEKEESLKVNIPEKLSAAERALYE
jgi:DnaJ-class molecular chaperone